MRPRPVGCICMVRTGTQGEADTKAREFAQREHPPGTRFLKNSAREPERPRVKLRRLRLETRKYLLLPTEPGIGKRRPTRVRYRNFDLTKQVHRRLWLILLPSGHTLYLFQSLFSTGSRTPRQTSVSRSRTK